MMKDAKSGFGICDAIGARKFVTLELYSFSPEDQNMKNILWILSSTITKNSVKLFL